MSLNLLPQPRALRLDEGLAPEREPIVTDDDGIPAEGYHLDITPGAITIAAADTAGEFYARATLAQLVRTYPGSLPCLHIEDWPDTPVRAVLVDISRDKVPTLPTLFDLVDRLSSWKVNQLQLYTEHTFAYRDHRDVWSEASALTADDIHALDDYCRARHVELVPNQNCLGHMERWLGHPRYAHLALAPEGFVERGLRRAPSTIDPTNPASLALVRELLAELLPNFTSRRVHVGLDEPWELPDERIDDYMSWLRGLRALPELDGHEMLVWGDILAGRPELIARLPDDVTVCEWGYDEGHPFGERAAAFEAAGTPFWVCPGTSSWLTILGRVTNMRETCARAAQAALEHGGRGFLNTDWGDLGHLQYLPVSDPGLAYGAAVGWCLDSNRDLDLAAALSAHCYDDPTGELGAALVELGDVYRIPATQLENLASMVLHLYYPQLQFGRGPVLGFTSAEFEAVIAALDMSSARVERATPRRADGALVRAEIENAIALVRLLARDALARLAGDGSLGSVPADVRRSLAGDLDVIIVEHRRLWHARNEPGGYPDSERWLTHLRDCYASGEADDTWPMTTR